MFSSSALAAGSYDVAAKHSSPLNCLKSLSLSNICLDELVELLTALCLIRSSPYLQDIQIKVLMTFNFIFYLWFFICGDYLLMFNLSYVVMNFLNLL